MAKRVYTTERHRGRTIAVTHIGDHAITISGRMPRVAKVRDEPFECVSSPDDVIGELKRTDPAIHLFTFMQELADPTPRHPYYYEADSQAVMPITTYDQWWKSQIDGKTRNMIRKASKSGVEVRMVPFDDALVTGIKDIYDETPLRQGKPFWHFGKDFETIKRDHSTFLKQSDFIGAFLGEELIGFVKLVRSRNVASLMQIISKVKYRDKAPTNALVAKSVEFCAQTGIPNLHYGVWSDGGLGAFKTSHGFLQHDVPRFYIPLSWRGAVLLRWNLHHSWSDWLPKDSKERLARWRNKWNVRRYRPRSTGDRLSPVR
jgi:hypothetical protein